MSDGGLRKTSVGGRFKESLALDVKPFPMIKGILPPALTSSSSTLVFKDHLHTISPLSFLLVTPSYGYMSITSPIDKSSTGISIGKAPESSLVWNKGNVIAKKPQNTIGSAFSTGPSSNDIS